MTYVLRQLQDLVEMCERITGKALDYSKLQRIVALSGEPGELWSKIKALTQRRPSPFDAYFDSVTLMALLYCTRGTEECLRFFETAYEELLKKADDGVGPLPEERFRVVIEGPPPWPFLRTFRDMFSKWGAVAVAPTSILLEAVLLYLFGALGFGLFISTVAHTQILAFQAGLISSMLPAILLSGFIFQIRAMPEALQLVTYLVPARYFLVILRGIVLKGEGLATYWPQVGALALFGFTAVAFASLRLARREA